ncbi:MMPL family protein [Gimesia alba]|uniref:MMPL family protein n=1 Tax=Gimesia alba TaxID=2527973 RepID=A0A517RP11_9PLAN|nr:MMPL family transporter [Gimesia alba]QDT45617.1 MMPL family protein [Gimesia alba]
MTSKQPRYVRRYVVTVILLVLVSPFLIYGAHQSVESMCIAPEKWAPPVMQSRQNYDKFKDHFESNDLLLISWPGCTVDDPRLIEFEAAINGPRTTDFGETHESLFDRIVSGAGVVNSLTSPPLKLPRDEALERLEGSLVGQDLNDSCAVIILTDRGNELRKQSIEHALTVAEEVCQLPREDFRVTGPPVDGVAIDRASIHSVNLFGALSTIVAIGLCWICIRSWMLTGTILLAGLCGQGLVLSMVYYSGTPLDAVLIITPSLVFVLTISAGVHLVNYYYDELFASGAKTKTEADAAVRTGFSKGWQPCLLAAVTTAIGLGSLMVSQISPIAMFGLIASIGLLVTLGILLLILPGAMQLWPPKQILKFNQGNQKTASPRYFTRISNWMEKLATVLERHSATVFLSSIVLMVVSAYGLLSIRSSVDVPSLFPAGSQVLDHYEFNEDRMGPLIPVEVVIEFDPDCKKTFLQRLRIIDDIEKTIKNIDGYTGTMSAATFGPNPVEHKGFESILRKVVTNKKLKENRQAVLDSVYLSENDGVESWRISARVPALQKIDYGAALAKLKTTLKPELEKYKADGVHLNAYYTGIMPLIHTVQQLILQDLTWSFLTAFLLVAIVIVIIQRSLWTGLLSMLPNVFPIVVVFGLMGWLDIPLDIGAVMTASVALGIAIDDTLHFLAWFRREKTLNRTSEEAIHSALKHCGRAMIHTTFICGLGLMVFGFSDFIPTQRFAWMMLALLTTALIGDLLFLPAMLMQPFAKHLQFAKSGLYGKLSVTPPSLSTK